MRITHLNKYDTLGGAARAAFRLHRGLDKIGIESKMFVDLKVSDEPSVHCPESLFGRIIAGGGGLIDRLPLKLYNWQRTRWHPAWLRRKHPLHYLKDSDIINLHWIVGGFLSIGNLASLAKLGKPVVWTLHDMWAFTGGCHYAGDCDKYKTRCGACSQLGSTRANDLSRWVFKRKQKAYPKLNLHIVTPSRWLGSCAEESPLFSEFPVSVIPGGLDTKMFKPISKKTARDILNLHTDKKIILFGAVGGTQDKRKGFSYLAEGLNHLKALVENPRDYMLLIFGASSPGRHGPLPFEANYAGILSDETSMALLYNCADVFVAPSLQDNLPNTVMESLACGTPVVAFETGGIPDMVEHKASGYLAAYKDSDDLAQGIKWVLDDKNRWLRLSEAACQKAERAYSIEVQARSYKALYEEILRSQYPV